MSYGPVVVGLIVGAAVVGATVVGEALGLVVAIWLHSLVAVTFPIVPVFSVTRRRLKPGTPPAGTRMRHSAVAAVETKTVCVSKNSTIT